MFTIGVVIPVYNRPALLELALASVLSQSRPPDDIVVVDDGSDPPVQLPSPGGKRPLFRVIRLASNQGASAARQAGIDALSTTHVAFLDSDDEWLPGKLEAQARHLATVADAESTALACGWRSVFADGRPDRVLVPVPASSAAEFAGGCWYSPGSTAIVARAAIARAGGFDASLRRLEDLDLFIRLGRVGVRLEVTPIVGAIVRRGSNARTTDVHSAADRLERRYSIGGTHPLDREGLTNLRAWLAMERAGAERSHKNWMRFIYWTAVSFVHRPRARVQLRRWWQSPGDMGELAR